MQKKKKKKKGKKKKGKEKRDLQSQLKQFNLQHCLSGKKKKEEKKRNGQMNSKIIDLSLLYSFKILALSTQTLSSKPKRLLR